MSADNEPLTSPPQTLPATAPGDTVLLRRPGQAIWAGAVSAWPEGFEFTLLVLNDVHLAEAPPPEALALHPGERGPNAWISVQYADGRARAADLNTNTPTEQNAGPHLSFIYGESSATEGWDLSRWWVTPLPPPGLIQLTIHLGHHSNTTGTGHLDGQAIIQAAHRTNSR
jgi:hypothetical protein